MAVCELVLTLGYFFCIVDVRAWVILGMGLVGEGEGGSLDQAILILFVAVQYSSWSFFLLCIIWFIYYLFYSAE